MAWVDRQTLGRKLYKGDVVRLSDGNVLDVVATSPGGATVKPRKGKEVTIGDRTLITSTKPYVISLKSECKVRT